MIRQSDYLLYVIIGRNIERKKCLLPANFSCVSTTSYEIYYKNGQISLSLINYVIHSS